MDSGVEGRGNRSGPLAGRGLCEMQARWAGERGYTLIDLMIVVVVAALLAVIAVPSYQSYVDRAQTTSAISDLGRIQLALARFQTNNGQLPATLAAVDMDTMTDPWGNTYRYLNIEAGANPGAVRKDRNLVPINSDYDLYSIGKDGDTRPPLPAAPSLDDIVRANNGSFFGRAEDY